MYNNIKAIFTKHTSIHIVEHSSRLARASNKVYIRSLPAILMQCSGQPRRTVEHIILNRPYTGWAGHTLNTFYNKY